MKKNVFWSAVLVVLVMGAGFVLYGSGENQWSDYAVGGMLMSVLDDSEPTHTVGRFQFPVLSEEDTFATYVYTYGDVVIFSYEDSTEFEVIDSSGNSVWSDTLMEDDYHLLSDLPYGVYRITSPKGFAVLSGDPFIEGLGCWYAVDGNNSPLSTKLLSVGPKISSVSDAVIAIFAYYDSTHVVVRDIDEGSIIWEGDLDSAEYYLQDSPTPHPLIFSVESTKPVSVVTLSGVVGTYAPAFNGTFTGQDFMTYCHNWTEASQDLNVIPWEDDATVVVTDLDDPADTIWQVVCPKKGEIKGMDMPQRIALYIHADKDISVAQTPWASYGASMIAFYMVRGIDRGGTGLGTEFYLPLEASVSWSSPEIYSRLHVVAFKDSTGVVVTRIPRDGGDEIDIWEGTLDAGEYYRYTCPEDDASAHAIYHVTATKKVATVASCNDRRGSDFFPVVNLPAIGISEEPPVTPATPVTHPSNWWLQASIGQQIVLQYSDFPHGFHAQVFDAIGQKVDELHSVSPSGTLTWGEDDGCYSPGVYFIRSSSEEPSVTQKVILIK